MSHQIFVLCFLITIGVTIGEREDIPAILKYTEGQTYFFYPDENGKLNFVDLLQQEPDLYISTEDQNAYFQLYTRNNPTEAEELNIGDAKGLSTSNFHKNKHVKIIVHGWQNNANSRINTLITEGFLKISDVNVVCVDWGYAANGLYTTAVRSAPKVAETIAKFINWLRNEGVPMPSFHLIGHSIGAHIVGMASRSITNGLISIVTGLDPASPLWGSDSQRIRRTDAIYVEIIHTNAGSLGLTEAIGDNDFYPNGGSRQPGCSFLEIGCSHSRAYEFYADSLDHQYFISTQCLDYNELYYGKCSNISKIHMGGTQVKIGKGLFLLKTNDKKPFFKD